LPEQQAQNEVRLDMVEYRCDGCGKIMQPGELRYTVTIDVRAAYDTLEVSLMDLVRNHRQEILDLLERLRGQDIQQVEDQIYKHFQRDLCPACHRGYIANPLQFEPESRGAEENVDVDTFLRSLGFGGGDTP
jgi:hypothetical protein